MTIEIFLNLSRTFFVYFSEEGLLESNSELCKEALSILKVLGINYKDKSLTFRDNEGITYIISYEELSREDRSSTTSRITPYNLSILDIESIDGILNLPNYSDFGFLLSPLLDSIGWIITKPGSNFHIEFKGSALYDSWKEFYFSQDLLNPLNGIWKRIDEEDGIELSDIKWV